MTPRRGHLPLVLCLLVVTVASVSGVGAAAVTVDSLNYGGDDVVSTPDRPFTVWQSDSHEFGVGLGADSAHETSVCLFTNASDGPRELGCRNVSLSPGDSRTVTVAVGAWPANLTGDRTVRAVVTDREDDTRLAERTTTLRVISRDADNDGDGLTNEAEVEAGTDLENRDTDNDTLSDALEVRVHGTSPIDTDTDADGLGDGLEVGTYNTDPLVADTDDDGIADGREVDLGTNPVLADTDGDGLEDGPELNTYQTDATAVDTDDDGLDDGTEVDLGTNPTAADTDGDGLGDGEEVTLYDTDPTRGDTDGDGLVDQAEVAEYGTDPTVADTDGDGLDDAVEVREYGTDPLVADTDRDGQDDGLEVRLGSNPNDATSTGDPGPVTTVSLFVARRPLLSGLVAGLVVLTVVGLLSWRFSDRVSLAPLREALATGSGSDASAAGDTGDGDAGGAADDHATATPADASSPSTSGGTDSDGESGEWPAGERSGSPSPAGESGSGTVQELPDDAVLTNEERVARLLEENGGRMLQSDMVEAADWSKATVSRVLTTMEEAGEVTRVDIGRGNLVARPGDEPDSAGSPFSE